MTHEQKDLLLKDLCSRLPYAVEVEYNNINCEVLSIDKYNEELTIWVWTGYSTIVKLEDVKPYLFPLSSMTEEQKKAAPFELSLLNAFINGHISLFEDEELTLDDLNRLYDWCNKNHFDYRGLIPMDLANDASGLNVY